VEKIERTDLVEANNAKYLPDKSGKQQHLEKKYWGAFTLTYLSRPCRDGIGTFFKQCLKRLSRFQRAITLYLS
jgi:hypothetical protein